MNRPIDVMIAGAQKAGTTSVLRYLGEHPQCVCHPQKEFAFFMDSSEYSKDYSLAYEKYYAHQQVLPDIRLIAKSAGLYTSDEGLKHLQELNPKCEIILILRNPVDRAYSSFLMEKNAGSVKYNFEDILGVIEKKSGWEFDFFIAYGLYEQHIRTIYKYFPKEQVSIFLHEDLKNKGADVCREIFTKLGLDANFVPDLDLKHNVTKGTRSRGYSNIVRKILAKRSLFRSLASSIISKQNAYKYGNALRKINQTKEKPQPIEPKLREALTAFYAPYNKSLSLFLGMDLSEWQKTKEGEDEVS
jgi:hypothetical protein